MTQLVAGIMVASSLMILTVIFSVWCEAAVRGH
jgi:hypothetical protein